MRYLTRSARTLGALLVPLALAACADDAPGGADEGTIAAMEQLPPELINQLKEEYPVLREEPAPPPRPSPDANPADVPERLEGILRERVLETATGGATFYADSFEGRRTASGIPFRQNQMVAAHRSFPFGTILRVTNLSNDRSANVRVVDRGPFGAAARRHGTIIDLSRRAANQLGFVQAGRAQVRVEVLEWGDGLPRAS